MNFVLSAVIQGSGPSVMLSICTLPPLPTSWQRCTLLAWRVGVALCSGSETTGHKDKGGTEACASLSTGSFGNRPVPCCGRWVQLFQQGSCSQ